MKILLSFIMLSFLLFPNLIYSENQVNPATNIPKLITNADLSPWKKFTQHLNSCLPITIQLPDFETLGILLTARNPSNMSFSQAEFDRLIATSMITAQIMGYQENKCHVVFHNLNSSIKQEECYFSPESLSLLSNWFNYVATQYNKGDAKVSSQDADTQDKVDKIMDQACRKT